MPHLVLIDDRDPCDALRERLHAAGYAVTRAGTGDQAYRLARELRPAVAIAALAMPDVATFVVDMRSDPRTRPTRLLATTTYRPDAARIALLAGFEACLRHPLEAEAVVAALHARPRPMSIP